MSLLTLLPFDYPYAIWDLLLVTGQVLRGIPSTTQLLEATQ